MHTCYDTLADWDTGEWGCVVCRRLAQRVLETVIPRAVRGVASTIRFMEALRGWMRRIAPVWASVRLRVGALWRLVCARSEGILRWPVVRPLSDWLGEQHDYMQFALISLSLAMAFLLAVAAGYIGLHPAVLTAKAEAPSHELAAVLYEWLEQRPALPSTQCPPHMPQEACWRQLAAGAEKWQTDFADYVARIQAEQRYAMWKHSGKDFPTYNRDTGVLTFTLALEGLVRADEKTCLPFRVIAEMPPGITAGLWPDHGHAKTRAAGILQRLPFGAGKTKTFPHPCLRATDWTAWVWPEPATAESWMARAKEKGWALEMFFRLDKAESPLLPNWDEDARLTDEDFLKEQRIWVWVDEVRLVIGDTVVHRWR